MILKNIRLLLLIVSAFLKRETKLVIISILVGVGVFLLINKLFVYIPRPKPTERIGWIGGYAFTDLPLEIINNTSNGLTRIDKNGLPLPSLAERWEISGEGKIYTFYLADNIFWQDGSPVKAQDINYDLPEVKQEVISNKVIKFTLKEAFAPFPSLLANPVFKNDYIGTGKYRINNLEKNGPYITRILLIGPDKQLLYCFYPTFDLAFQAFKIGEIDELPATYTNPFDKIWDPYLSVEERIANNYYIGLFLNNQDKYLSNKNLRQALAYATIKPDDKTRAIGPINPDSWAFNTDVKLYETNAPQAKKLFDKFKSEAKIDQLKLTLITTGNFILLAEQIKQNWQEVLGIQTEISSIDQIPTDFQALLIISQIPTDPDQYTFWHSTQDSNITRYQSPKVDKILEDARRSANLEERKEKYSDFQKFLLEDIPVIFLSHPKLIYIKRKKMSFF